MKKIIFLILFPTFLFSQNNDWNKKKLIDFFNFNEYNDSVFYKSDNFSSLYYSSFSGERKKIRLLHHQKLNKFLNINLDVKKFSQEGVFTKSIGKFHDVNFSVSFINKKNSYLIKSFFNYKKMLLQENGGLINYQINEFNDPLLYLSNLKNAENSGKIRQFLIKQRFKLSTNFKLFHLWKRNKKSRKYIDNYPLDGFYSNIYYDFQRTADSLYFQEDIHELKLSYNNLTLGYILNSDIFFNFFNDTSIFKRGFISIYNSNRVFNGLLFNFNKDSLDLTVKYFNNGQYNLYFSFLRNNINLQLSLNKNKIDPYFLNYTSNHFIWNNDFKMTENQFLKINYFYKIINFNLLFKREKNTSFIDNNLNWQQNLTGLYQIRSSISNKFKFGIFNSKNNFIYQWNSDEKIIREPEFQFINTSFINKKIFKKSLEAKFGFDFIYYSKYESKSYIPSLSLFYLENNFYVGNYFIINPFVEAKISSALLRFELNNFQEILFNKKYFIFTNYPFYPMSLQFNLVWNLN